MNELFPIIRRKRRPLMEPDAPLVVVDNVEPLKVELENTQHSAEQSESLLTSAATETKEHDA